MPATIAGSHLGLDTHANRPAANAAGQPFGALYSCSTHGLVYKTDGSTWATWATLGETGVAAHLADTSDAHDASAISFSPAGTIAATDVQAAIEEVAAEAGGGGGSGFSRSGTGDLTSAFSTGNTSFTDVTGLSVTKSTAAVRCMVCLVANVSNNNAGSWTAVTLDIDGANQGSSTLGLAAFSSANANDIGFVGFVYWTAVLSAASHTFKVQMRVSAGTGKIREDADYSLTVIETDIAA